MSRNARVLADDFDDHAPRRVAWHYFRHNCGDKLTGVRENDRCEFKVFRINWAYYIIWRYHLMPHEWIIQVRDQYFVVCAFHHARCIKPYVPYTDAIKPDQAFDSHLHSFSSIIH